MTHQFLCFGDHCNSRMYARTRPGDNVHSRTSDGSYDPYKFINPFKCSVRRTQFADIVWSHLGLVCLFSDRMRRILESERITGIDYEPANVCLLFPHEPSDSVYWVVRVTGWGGVAPSESGIKRVDIPESQAQLLYTPCLNPKALVDPDRWDGSDIFLVWPLPMHWWISPRLRGLLEQHNIKHYRVTPPEKVTFPKPIDGIGFRPGRLRRYFPEVRARQLGEPLGIY